jgi:hypothetical protein
VLEDKGTLAILAATKQLKANHTRPLNSAKYGQSFFNIRQLNFVSSLTGNRDDRINA